MRYIELSAGTFFWSILLTLFCVGLVLNAGHSTTYSFINLSAGGRTINAQYCRDGSGNAGPCSAALTYSDQKAIDQKLGSDEWLLADTNKGPTPNNITIDLKALFSVGRVTFYNARAGYTVNGFNVWISTDNLTFTKLNSSNQTDTPFYELNITFAPVSAEWIRFETTSAYTNGTGGAAEFYVWGEAGADIASPIVTITMPSNNSGLNPNKNNLSVLVSDDIAVSNVTVFGDWAQPYGMCYQESANTTNQTGVDGTCGLNYGGKYGWGFDTTSAYWTPNAANLYDGNPTTYAEGIYVGGTAHFEVNYSKPRYIGSDGNIWTTKGSGEGEDYFNISVANVSGLLRFQFESYKEGTSADYGTNRNIYNFATNNWIQSHRANASQQRVNEEAMWWNASLFPYSSMMSTSPTNNTNSTFNLSGVPDGTYSGYAKACDTSNKCTTSSNYTFVVDTNNPSLSDAQTTPNQTTIQQGSAIAFNVTASDTNLQAVWLELGNGTNYTAASLGYGLYAFQFGSLTNGTYNWRMWANDSAGNSNNTATYVLTSYLPYLGACGGISNTTALNFTFFDEDTLQKVSTTLRYNGTISGTGLVVGTNGTGTGTSVWLCIYPTLAQFSTTMTLDYNASGYVQRFYYVYNLTATATTTNITVYNLAAGQETNVTVSLLDSGASPLSDAYVYYYRWYTAENAYRLVATGKSSNSNPADGLAYVKLKSGPDVYYRKVLMKDGIVLNTYEGYFSASTTDTARSEMSGLGTVWGYLGKTSGSCNVTGSGNKTIVCSGVDTSGTPATFHLNVFQANTLGLPNETLCSVTTTSSAVQPSCYLGNISGHNFYYTFTVDKNGELGYQLANGQVSGTSRYDSAAEPMSIILGFIITLGLGGLGSMFGPSGSIVGLGLGITISEFIGITHFGATAVILIWVGIAAIILKLEV